jgi:uridylate kinase
MDLPALALAAERRLKIVVFNAHRPGNLVKALRGQLTCSQIGPE